MDLQALLESLSKIDAASFAASGSVLLSNLAIILACGWALYRTGLTAFAWLLVAAAGSNFLIVADFLLAPRVTAWLPASAEGWRIFRFLAYLTFAAMRAWGIWLLARAAVEAHRKGSGIKDQG